MARIEKHPPANPEAESAVLGALLIDPDARRAVARILQPEDFYTPKHALVYRAIIDLGDVPADPVTVEDLLEKRGQLDQVGWGIVNELISKTPSSLHASHYAGLVADCARRRRWIDAAGRIAGAAYSDDGADPGEVARQLLQEDRRPGGWKWKTLAAAYEPRPARRYLAGGLLPLPCLAVLYGPPGALKSMLLADLAICVSAGLPWLEPLEGEPGEGRTCDASPCLWVDCDNGLDRTERRLAALGRGHGAPEKTLLAYVSFPIPPFIAQDPAAVQTVIDAALRCGAGLICLDNLGTVSGGADENSSQMVAVMAGLRRIAEETGAAVVVIHHRNKGSNRARAGDALRGHSSIEAALDLSLQVEREEDSDAITLRSTKSRDATVDPFAALWTYERDEAGELVSGRFFGLGRPETEAMTKAEQARVCILTDLQDGWSQSQIVAHVKAEAGVSRCTTLAALKKLTHERRLYARVGGPGQAVIYERAKAEVV